MLKARSLALTTPIVLLLLVPLLALVGRPLPAAGATAACAHPVYTTTAQNGMWSHGVYTVANDMWNSSGYTMTQRLRVCSPSRWTADVRVANPTDTAVKSYPNSHRDYHNWSTGYEPRLSTFRSLHSTWAARTPGVGTYDAAYDIWLNGVPGKNEVMIWTDNRHQVPAGSRVGKLWFDHRRWQIWSTPNHSYVAFVPPRRLTHGTLNLLTPLHYLSRRGWFGKHPTLGQVDFGFEVVRTAGERVRFATTAFSVTSRR